MSISKSIIAELPWYFNRELKEETEAQLKEFEEFLQRILKQDAESNAAQEAADKIEAAKTKIFGVQAAKAALENKEGDILRGELATMKEQY